MTLQASHIAKGLLAATVLAGALAAQAQTVEVKPAAPGVTVGDTFTVDVVGRGFAQKVVGGGYDLAYDTGLLDLVSVSIPGIWEFAVSEGTKNEAAGTVTDVFFNTFAAPVAGDFLTATLTFKATGVGTANISALASGLFPFGNEQGEAVDVTFVGGSVAVAAVPEPASWALAAAGLCIAGAFARRRRA